MNFKWHREGETGMLRAITARMKHSYPPDSSLTIQSLCGPEYDDLSAHDGCGSFVGETVHMGQLRSQVFLMSISGLTVQRLIVLYILG